MGKINIIITALVILGISSIVFGQQERLVSHVMTPDEANIDEIVSVNPYNGFLNFSLPLIQTSGRGEFSTSSILKINRQFLRKEMYQPENGWYPSYFLEDDIARLVDDYGPGLLKSINDGAVDPVPAGFSYHNSEQRVTLQWESPDGSTHDLIDQNYNGLFLKNSNFYSGSPGAPPECSYAPPSVYHGSNRGKIFSARDGSGIVFTSDEDIYDNVCSNTPEAPQLNSSGYMRLANGTTYRIDMGQVTYVKDRNGNTTFFTYSSSSYGNRLNMVTASQAFHYPALPGYGEVKRVQTVTDSVGRKIEYTYDNADVAPYLFYDQINYVGFGGQSRTLRIHYSKLENSLSSGNTLKTYCQLNIDCQGSTSGSMLNPYVAAAVELPDHRLYKFKYNSYGEVSRFTLPTGAAIEYDYAFAVTPPIQGDDYFLPGVYRRVIEQREYENGETGGAYDRRTVYSQPSSQYDTSNDSNFPTFPTYFTNEYVDVSEFGHTNTNDILISRTRHYYYGVATAPNKTKSYYGLVYYSWKNGKEYKTEIFGEDNSTLLRRIENEWRQKSDVFYTVTNQSGQTIAGSQDYAPENFPRIVETITTLENNLVTKRSSINPQTGEIGFDVNNNQTDVYEFDYGVGTPGLFKRRTHTDFVTDASYVNANLKNLPSQTWVSSDVNGSNKASLTQYEYDNYSVDPLIARASVIGHDTTNYGTSNITRGNITKVTSYSNAQNQTGAISVKSQYDVLGNVIKTIDAKGNASTIDYTDRFGSPDGEAQSNTAPSYINGQNTTTYPLNGQSTFAFSTQVTHPSPFQWSTYTQFDYFTGQIVNKEDINGVVSKTVYDDLTERPKQLVTAVGTSLEMQSTIVYDDDNHRIEAKSDLNALNDNLIKSESFYDGFGKIVKNRKYEANGGYIETQSIPFVMVQDPETSIWREGSKQTNPYRPLVGEQPVWTTSLNYSLGSKVITSDGAIIKTEYSGNTVTVTDQAGKQRRSIIDALGLLSRVDEPDVNNSNQLGSVDAPNQPTYYEYDALNNLTKVKQGGTLTNPQQTRLFVYDSLSRLKQATNPESGTISYVYDNNGNLTTKTDARAVVTTCAYDNLNRIISRSYSAPSSLGNYQASLPVTYTYDDANIANSKGRLTKVTTGTNGNIFSETSYISFDILGRVMGSRQMTDGVTYNPQSYVYNLSGELIEETYPSGRVVKNVLDNEGELSMVQSKKNASAGFINYAKHFNYTASGAVSSMQLGNGRWESTQFNSRLQPTQIALGTVQNGTDKLKLNFAYNTVTNSTPNADNNGNVLSQTITVPTETRNNATYNGFTATQTYTYDSLNRLHDATETISNNQQWKQTFTYDRYGNRTFDEAHTTTLQANCPVAVCNPQIDPNTNKLIGYQFDTSGNTKIDAENRQFIYDSENKQVEVKDVTGISIGKYFYDGNGKRVKKVTDTEVTLFVYDVNQMIIAEYSTQVSQTPQISYLTNDNLGSSRINTDATGQITARHDYHPFGEEIVRMNYGSDDVRRKFTGYQRDAETNLDFAQARMYANKLGRFMAPDYVENSPVSKKPDPIPFATLRNPQTFNQYAYVNNNPLNAIDSTGHGGKMLAVPGTSGQYYYRADTNNAQDYRNIHIKDKQGNEVARVSIKGTAKKPIYEWEFFGNGISNKVKTIIEDLAVAKKWTPKPPINASDPALNSPQATEGAEFNETLPEYDPKTGKIGDNGRFGGGNTFNGFISGVAAFDLFTQIYLAQQQGGRLGFYYNFLNEVVIVDVNRAAQNLPQNTLYRFEGNGYQIVNGTFVDIHDKSCTLTQTSGGEIMRVCSS